MSVRGFYSVFVLLGIALGFSAMPAAAAPITYEFRGNLTIAIFSGEDTSEWPFIEGDPFSGTLVYDPDLVASSYDYISTPDWKLTFHSSPIISLTYKIETNQGIFDYAPPLQESYAAIAAGEPYINWSGVDLRFQNYAVNGAPYYPVDMVDYIGNYYAHSSFVQLLDYESEALTDTGADIDLAALFNKIQPSRTSFAIRFSDPSRWAETPGGERVDGFVFGQINSFSIVNSSVPEPAVWGMMIIGFGAIGTLLRRRHLNGSHLSNCG